MATHKHCLALGPYAMLIQGERLESQVAGVFCKALLISLLCCSVSAAVLVGFNGCQHGADCMRCLALAALHCELNLQASFPIVMPQEPHLRQLGDLSDDQLFGVAVCVLACSRYIAATRDGCPAQAPAMPTAPSRAWAGPPWVWQDHCAECDCVRIQLPNY
jgi:hypothetical protein